MSIQAQEATNLFTNGLTPTLARVGNHPLRSNSKNHLFMRVFTANRGPFKHAAEGKT